MSSSSLPSLSALALLSLAWSSGSALAQPVISGDYYEENKNITCVSSACTVEFSALPSKVLMTEVACLFAGFASQIAFVELGIRDSSGGLSRRLKHLPPGPSISVTGAGLLNGRSHSVLTPVDYMMAPGKYPTIRAYSEQSNANANI